MNCAQWQDRVALYAGGDLPPDEAAPVERHLAECAQCAAFARGLTETLAIMKSAHDEPLPPVHFDAPVARTSRSALSFRWLVLAAAAAALAAIFIAPRQPGPVPPPVAIARHVPPPTIAFVRPVQLHKPIPRKSRSPRHAEPVLVQIVTDNPDVVLYWIADPKGDAR